MKSNMSIETRWREYLDASDNESAGIIFGQLFTQARKPLDDLLIKIGVKNQEEREERLQQVGIKLWTRLEKLRQSGDKNVDNFLSYAFAATRNLCIDIDVRRAKPIWSDLYLRVRCVLTAQHEDNPFYISGKRPAVCGLTTWKRKWFWHRNSAASRLADIQAENYREFQMHWDRQHGSDLRWADAALLLPDLMLAVMQWIETPIAVNELVFHLSNLMQHGDVAVISTEELAADQKPIFEPRSTDDPAGEVIALDGFRKEYAAWNDAMRAVVLLGTTRTMLI